MLSCSNSASALTSCTINRHPAIRRVARHQLFHHSEVWTHLTTVNARFKIEQSDE